MANGAIGISFDVCVCVSYPCLNRILDCTGCVWDGWYVLFMLKDVVGCQRCILRRADFWLGRVKMKVGYAAKEVFRDLRVGDLQGICVDFFQMNSQHQFCI